MTHLNKARAIAKKIKLQFPSTSEGSLMFAVFENALYDATRGCLTVTDKMERESAIRYLSKTIPHCEIAGVNSEWVHRLINKADIGFRV